MDWLVTNWFWILIFVLFIAMHLFGHGGHGAHGGHGGAHGEPNGDKREKKEAERGVINKNPHAHQH